MVSNLQSAQADFVNLLAVTLVARQKADFVILSAREFIRQGKQACGVSPSSLKMEAGDFDTLLLFRLFRCGSVRRRKRSG